MVASLRRITASHHCVTLMPPFYPLWRAFSKISGFVDKNSVSKMKRQCDFKQKLIGVDMLEPGPQTS